MLALTIVAAVRYQLPQAVGLVWESHCPLPADSDGSHVNAYGKSYPKRRIKGICHEIPAADMSTVQECLLPVFETVCKGN